MSPKVCIICIVGYIGKCDIFYADNKDKHLNLLCSVKAIQK